jgi:hypothetical protein
MNQTRLSDTSRPDTKGTIGWQQQELIDICRSQALLLRNSSVCMVWDRYKVLYQILCIYTMP